MSKIIAKKTSNKRIKQELLNSLQENDDVEEQGVNETANSVNNSQEAIIIICHDEDITKTQNKKQEGILVTRENFLKSSKILKTFFIMSVQADQRFILKFNFLSF